MKIIQTRINPIVASKQLLFVLLLLFFLPTILVGSKTVEKSVYANQQTIEDTGVSGFGESKKDPGIVLLGKKFAVIKQILGEPAEEGYSTWLGPHHYMLFKSEKGFIRFCSPEGVDNKTAISIIMGPGQEIYGVRVGMYFSEIMAILGKPDRGPELAINNLYYMDYYLGKFNDQVPEVFISFSAGDINGSTQDAFIKWEAYESNQKGQL